MDKTKDLTLRVFLFASHRKPESFDTARIHFAPEYLFLENIYSTLVEYSPEGELVSGVAETFEWVGTEARFKIRENLVTIDGHKITGYDVENTIKRLFILSTNTHGNLKDMLCPSTKLRKISDACPGMQVRESGQLFVMKFQERKPFLFPMLSALDFGIIPAISIDSKTLKIIDYKNTSGPYYAPSKDGIDLKANPRHYRYSKKIPQNIKYVYPIDKNKFNRIKDFTEGKIDHIPTIGSIPGVLIPYAATNKAVTLHVTYPFRLTFFAFTRKGRNRLSERERFEIGNLVRKTVLPRYLNIQGYEPTQQIFPVFGEGVLSIEQSSSIKAKAESFGTPDCIKMKMTAWNFPEADLPALKAAFPNTKFISSPGIPGLIDYTKERFEEPDFYFCITDMSFQEDISLLSYHLNLDFFSVTGEGAKKWANEYSSIPDKSKRIEKLNKLHFQTLKEGVAIPLVFSSYAAILRKPWVFGLSRYYANNPLWRIYRD